MKRWPSLVGAAALAASAACAAHADTNAPANVVALTVTLPNPAQKVFYVHETMPVAPGKLTLYYPKYIPGDHAPDGPIGAMMGLEISAGGRRIAWQRDPVDMFTFHLDVPAGVGSIDIRFQIPDTDRITPNLMDLTWDHMALYRAGEPTKDQLFRPTLEMPATWGYGTALETDARDGGRIRFKPVPFNTLVDSPVIAGQYFRQIDVTPADSSVHRWLDLVGDSEAALQIKPEQLEGYRNLVVQAQNLFHSHHYANYHFLLTLSDHTSVGGLEHHQSSDDRARGGSHMFADPEHFMLDGSLLPHEYTHSWNGKFMRPAGLWQPDFEQPEIADGLWVYEGLTVYLGDALTARSGLWSAQDWRDALAYRAATFAHRPGREWRPLSDTTRAAQLLYGGDLGWVNWRRGTDFYREGQLLWLAVDTKIRALSHDKRTLDDFAQRFFSKDDGSYVTQTYTSDDVVAALNAVQPWDWAKFLHGWMDGVGDEVPLLSGIEQSGWKLVYTDTPSRYQNAVENVGKSEFSASGVDETFSVGLFINHDGNIMDVLWQGPAFKAGLAPEMKLQAVDGHAYTPRVLRDAIVRAQKDKRPIQIQAEMDGISRTYAVDYFGGLRYPHLVRVAGTPDYLSEILAAKH
ncbi:M61 family metallopeptidase [Rhodanobacter sp. 7MK24]|uniref:M61 family metallopeptidase n=1 Tax=Rhodanobacter sp. 7MK24 TaxID=2775922 RepID=UPI001781E06C|nr:M61 family metallopeptidase [Rhodanobacter sp. 7MK24]MBD8880389.1 M61 family metallopeptidase [Rhodanobacter sp. 7MK24]